MWLESCDSNCTIGFFFLFLFFNSAIQPILLPPLVSVTALSVTHVFLVQQSISISRISSPRGSFRVTSSARVLMLCNTTSPMCVPQLLLPVHTLEAATQPDSISEAESRKMRVSLSPSLHCSPLGLFVFAENWAAAGWVFPGSEGQSEDRHRGGLGLLQDSGAARRGGWRWAQPLQSAFTFLIGIKT